jgi:hypothetical protein
MEPSPEATAANGGCAAAGGFAANWRLRRRNCRAAGISVDRGWFVIVFALRSSISPAKPEFAPQSGIRRTPNLTPP